MSRRTEEFRDFPLLHDRTGIEHHDLVAELGHQTQAVRDEDRRAIERVPGVPEQLSDLGLDRGIERRRRLVRDQQIRLDQQGHGDHDALAHAAAELVGIVSKSPLRIGDADLAQHVGRPLPQGAGRVLGESWKTIATERPRSVAGSTTFPRSRTSPFSFTALSESKPISTLARVDFPLPLSPTIPTIFLARRDRSMLRNTENLAPRFPMNETLRSLTSTRGGGGLSASIGTWTSPIQSLPSLRGSIIACSASPNSVKPRVASDRAAAEMITGQAA
jgi:hypothetical protein